MGNLYDSNGNLITQPQFLDSGLDPYTGGTQKYVVNNRVYEYVRAAGSTRLIPTLKFYTGQVITQNDVDEVSFGEPEPEPTPSVTSITPNTGPAAGGTVVTIAGSALNGSTGATFGGTAGTAFTVDSDTSITVTTPAGTAGAVDVVVQNPAGNATVSGGFTYE